MSSYIIARLLLLPFLLYISVADVKHHKIFNWVQPILLCWAVFISNIHPVSRLLGALIPAVPFYFYARHTKKMGMGDVKLMFSLGWCIGLLNIFATAAANIFFLFTTFRKPNKPIAFAPYLCGAFTVCLFIPYFLY